MSLKSELNRAMASGNVSKVSMIVRDMVSAMVDQSIGLAFVPLVVDALGPRGVEAMDMAARAGAIELRPESGMGRLTAKERSMCVPGFEGCLLSWARPI